VIAAGVRSPIGRAHKGRLREVRPDDLCAQVVTAALARVPELDPASIEDLYVGAAEGSGEQGKNLARVVSVLCGLDGVPGSTVNRFCASSLQTTRMAYHAILAGEGDVFVSAGVESVSRYRDYSGAPMDTRNPRFTDAEQRSAHPDSSGWRDPREIGDLPDIYIGMGQTAENIAQVRGITRADQDQFADRSQRRAADASQCGFFAGEIVPVIGADNAVIDADESPRPATTIDALSALAPAFRPGGSVTAGNACPLSDGAAALVVMSGTRARDLGVEPLGRIVSTGVSALSPEIMGLGPVEASRRALARAGMSMGDIDLCEINEAFAAQVLASARDLAVDEDRLNVNGGAIALGHPFGMTGARLLMTMLRALSERDSEVGLVTMCIGGGQGMAIVVERI
jgi:acetyl-CoA C-acetyltransferase